MSNCITHTILSCLVLASCVFQASQSFTESKGGVSHPAKIMDYKIQVNPGKEECVFLHTEPNAVLYVGFHVIRGGDSLANFVIRDPKGLHLLPYAYKTMETYETNSTLEGYYTICVDNQHSKFSSKVVGIYMATYLAEEWDTYLEEINQIGVHTDVFGQTFKTVSEGINQMLQYLYQSKSQEAWDFALLTNNNYNISFWSFVQCIIIVGTSLINVYTIRRFFRESPSTGKFSAKL